jgi:tRNA(Ile)-lysidine synthase
VGCSGGADSLALVYCAYQEANNYSVDLIPVVVDHGLQAGSDLTAAQVVRELERIGLTDIFTIRAQVEMNDGLEASARRARYLAFDQAIDTYNPKFFLLGHTINDQAETVLLGIARGSGTKSLSGMPAENGIYLRPLLSLTREITVAACNEAGLNIWNDPHNSDQRFTRVRVRENILPMMEQELGPGITQALARSAKILREDAQALDQWATEIFSQIDPTSIEIELLAGLPVAVRARVIRLAIYAQGAPLGSISADHLAPIEALVTGWKGQGPSSLPGGVKVARISGRLSLLARPD